MSDLKQNVALITGGTGFIGSHLTRRLIDDGWIVHIVLPKFEGPPKAFSSERLFFHVHDGTTEGLLQIVTDSNPLIVFHLASLFLAQHKVSDIMPLIQSNVLFPTQMLEAMTAHGVRWLINTGTSWQHFDNEDYNPACLYAATKQAFEELAKFYVQTSPMRMITLKLFDTYGPNDPRPKLFALLKRTLDTGQRLAMSPGEQLIDLVYIDDIIDAFLLAAHRLMEGKVASEESYAISSGAPIKLRDVVKLFEKAAGRELAIDWGQRPYRAREVMVPWNRGQPLPGWEPRVPIAAGIGRLFEVPKQRLTR